MALKMVAEVTSKKYSVKLIEDVDGTEVILAQHDYDITGYGAKGRKTVSAEYDEFAEDDLEECFGDIADALYDAAHVLDLYEE